MYSCKSHVSQTLNNHFCSFFPFESKDPALFCCLFSMSSNRGRCSTIHVEKSLVSWNLNKTHDLDFYRVYWTWCHNMLPGYRLSINLYISLYGRRMYFTFCKDCNDHGFVRPAQPIWSLLNSMHFRQQREIFEPETHSWRNRLLYIGLYLKWK